MPRFPSDAPLDRVLAAMAKLGFYFVGHVTDMNVHPARLVWHLCLPTVSLRTCDLPEVRFES